MARPKSCKVYLKRNNTVYSFLWINVAPDGSVLLGIQPAGHEFIHRVFDNSVIQRNPRGYIKSSPVEHKKISFHKSGKIKIDSQLGKSTNSIDRCTIRGKPLSEIRKPELMVEFILPNHLQEAKRAALKNDLVIDISQFPQKAVRCSVLCMDKDNFETLKKTETRIVNSSTHEIYDAVTNGSSIWVFLMRVSNNDSGISNILYYFIPGQIKWGKTSAQKGLL